MSAARGCESWVSSSIVTPRSRARCAAALSLRAPGVSAASSSADGSAPGAHGSIPAPGNTLSWAVPWGIAGGEVGGQFHGVQQRREHRIVVVGRWLGGTGSRVQGAHTLT